MKKQWYFDRYCGQQFAALIEDGKLAEYAVEKEPREELVGNIYKGKVTNVLTGMNAAFVSCGLERNCYLSMEETYTDYTKYDGTCVSTGAKPLDLKVGDELIVQVMKPPRGNKGAKVTTHISFVGRRLIYMPCTDFLGISRKITDEAQRGALLKTADELRGGKTNQGFIIRTQAPFATKEQLQQEAAYLKKLYLGMLRYADGKPAGTLLHEEEDLPTRCLRDSFGDDFDVIHVGDEELYKRLKSLLALRDDIPENKLVKYMGARSMFREYGIDPLIYEIASPVVELETGGYLVIEHTEAMTVVDVNTGKYIGTDKREDTVFAVNVAAAKEIAKQVRLRNIGGIVVVDFIDMAEENHRQAVNDVLCTALSADRAKCNVLPMSELCLTQFTRKRVGNESSSYLVKPCAHCKGIGDVHDDIFVITRLRGKILDCFADGNGVAIIELNEKIMDRIINEKIFEKELQTRWTDKRIYFIPHKTYKEDYFSVRGESADFSDSFETAILLR